MVVREKALAQLLASMAAKIHIAGYKEGLQPVHWVALRYFSVCSENAATVMQFAAHHQSTKGTASTTISLLVKKGLLQRLPVVGDKRSHRVKLTDHGRQMLKNDPLNQLETIMTKWDQDTQVTLASALGSLLKQF